MSGEVHTAENKNNFRAHIRTYRMYNGSAPLRTPNVSLSLLWYLCVCVCRFVGLFERERERQRGCVGVCVSTCYIIESGGRECCLACHTTVAPQWE